jgi:hypothetical protein
MTPAQIEAAARELCRIRAIPPEKEYAPGMAAWQHAAIEVERFAQIGEAIIAAQQTKAPRKRKEKQA